MLVPSRGRGSFPGCALPAQEEEYQQRLGLDPLSSSGWNCWGLASSRQDGWGRTPSQTQYDDQIWEIEVLSGTH